MPRVAKNRVEFEVDGRLYEAVFHHFHSHGELKVLTGNNMEVKHLNICTLGEKGGSKAALGEAACSLKDKYDWRYGVKLSLHRALEVIGVSPDTERGLYGRFLQSFYKEMANRPEREDKRGSKAA